MCKTYKNIRGNIFSNAISVELERGCRLRGEPFQCTHSINSIVDTIERVPPMRERLGNPNTNKDGHFGTAQETRTLLKQF